MKNNCAIYRHVQELCPKCPPVKSRQLINFANLSREIMNTFLKCYYFSGMQILTMVCHKIGVDITKFKLSPINPLGRNISIPNKNHSKYYIVFDGSYLLIFQTIQNILWCSSVFRHPYVYAIQTYYLICAICLYTQN